MNKKISPDEIKKELPLGDGTRIILIDRMAMEDLYGKIQCARNIYHIDKYNNILWQVISDFDYEGSPYTNFSIRGDSVSAYRWDGGRYIIDIVSGVATPDILAR